MTVNEEPFERGRRGYMDMTDFTDEWSIYSDLKLKVSGVHQDILELEIDRLGKAKVLKAWRDYLAEGHRDFARFLQRLGRRKVRGVPVC